MAHVATSYFWVGRLSGGSFAFPGEIRAASVFNYALTEAEIKRLDEAEKVGANQFDGYASYQSDFSESPAGFTPAAPGVNAVSAGDRINDSDNWLEIKRQTGSGSLVARLDEPLLPLAAGYWTSPNESPFMSHALVALLSRATRMMQSAKMGLQDERIYSLYHNSGHSYCRTIRRLLGRAYFRCCCVVNCVLG